MHPFSTTFPHPVPFDDSDFADPLPHAHPGFAGSENGYQPDYMSREQYADLKSTILANQRRLIDARFDALEANEWKYILGGAVIGVGVSALFDSLWKR